MYALKNFLDISRNENVLFPYSLFVKSFLSGLLPSSVLKIEDDKKLDIFQIYFPLIFICT